MGRWPIGAAGVGRCGWGERGRGERGGWGARSDRGGMARVRAVVGLLVGGAGGEADREWGGRKDGARTGREHGPRK